MFGMLREDVVRGHDLEQRLLVQMSKACTTIAQGFLLRIHKVVARGPSSSRSQRTQMICDSATCRPLICIKRTNNRCR